MAQKTVTKKMLKWLPLSVDILEKLDSDEKAYKYHENTGETEAKEINQDEYEDIQVVESTGEIIDETPKAEEPKEEKEIF